MLLKKFISILVTLVLMVSFIPNTIVYATEEILILLDFEENSKADVSKIDRIVGKEHTKYEVIEQTKGRSMVFSPLGVARIEKKLKESLSEGIVKYSMDFMAEQATLNPLLYLRVYNSSFNGDISVAQEYNMFETLNITDTINYVVGSKGWTLGDNKTAIEAMKWYDIDVYFDMNERKVHYYIDGEPLGVTGMHTNMTDIKGILLQSDSAVGNRICVDNVTVSHMTEEDAIEIYNNGGEIPYAIAREISFQRIDDVLGNIYYNKDEQEFKTKVRNKTGETREAAITYQVNDGEIQKQLVSLEPYEEKDVSVYTRTNEYGFFDITFALTNGNEKIYSEPETTRFSVVHVPKDGIANEKLGTTIHSVPDHTIRMGDAPTNMQLARNIGIGFVRTEMWWQRFEAAPGVFEVPDWYQRTLDKAEAIDMPIAVSFTFGNNIVLPVEEYAPYTDYGRERFAMFVAENLKVHGSLANGSSVWNEWNINGCNPYNRPPEDYASLLKASYEAAKKTNPDIPLWGLVSAGIDQNFIDRVLAAGGGDYMDGLDVHWYGLKSTPDKSSAIGDFNRLKELMEKYNIADKPVYLSEWGWASVGEDGYADEMEQASYNVRFLIMGQAYDWFDKSAYYTFSDASGINHQENRFGLVRSFAADIPHEAKPAYLSMGNYNALMIGAEFKEILECTGNNKGYRFKLADGRDCIAAWCVDGREDLGLKLGTDKVELYDMYGNAEEYYAANGVFSFGLDKDVNYIIGNFSEVKVVDALISTDEIDINIVDGDFAEINLNKTINAEIKLEVEADERISIKRNDGFSDGKAEILLYADGVADNSSITLRAIQDGKCVYKAKLNVNYGDPVEVSILGVPYNSGNLERKQIRFEISSSLYEGTTAGTLKITGPKELADAVKPVKLLPIAAGQKRYVRVNLPSNIPAEDMLIEAELDFDDGRHLDVKRQTGFEACVYAKKKPIIDGIIEKDEWEKVTRTRMIDKGIEGEKFVVLDNNVVYGGNTDLSAYAYTMWDETNFYLAMEITDDVWDYDKTNVLWRSDGLQFGMAPYRGSKDVMVAGLAKVDEKRFNLDACPNPLDIGPVKNAEYEIKRNGNITTYEVCVPWKSLFPSGYDPIAGTSMAFSMLINDNDGAGRRGYLEYGSGIGSGLNDSGIFMDLYLQGKN